MKGGDEGTKQIWRNVSCLDRTKKFNFADQRFVKASIFPVIFWSFLVKKTRVFVPFASPTFANLRFRRIDALRYKLLITSEKRLRTYGEGGIRTLGTRLKVQRFSKAPLSTAQPPHQDLRWKGYIHVALGVKRNL
jgi:hypothetical protein